MKRWFLALAVVQILVISPAAMAAPANHARAQPLAQLRIDVHEACAGGREHPFITVYREHGGPNPGYIELQRAQSLRTVYVQQNAALVEKARDFLERRAKAGRVVQHADRD